MNAIAAVAELIVSVAVPSALGWLIIDLWIERGSGFFRAEKLCLAFGLGMGILTLVMFFLALTGVGFSMIILGPLIALIIGCLGFVRLRKGPPNGPPAVAVSASPNATERVLSLVLCAFFWATVLITFLRTMVIEWDHWDSWAFWAFKAKIFYLHHTIPLGLFQKFKEVWGNWDYPHHVPLMEAWVFLCRGRWDDMMSRSLFPLYYTALCGVAYFFLRRYTERVYALLAVSFIATLRGLQAFTIGTVSEPVLIFYYLASSILLYRWMKEGQPRLMILSAVLLGMAGWVKNEGLAMIACNCLVLALFLVLRAGWARALRSPALWLYASISVLIVLPWNIYKKAAHIEHYLFKGGYLSAGQMGDYAARAGKIPQLFWYYLTNISSWNIVWMLLVAAAGYAIVRREKDIAEYFFPATVGIHCAVYGIMYVTYPQESVFVLDAMERLMLTPAVLTLVYCGLILGKMGPRRQPPAPSPAPPPPPPVP